MNSNDSPLVTVLYPRLRLKIQLVQLILLDLFVDCLLEEIVYHLMLVEDVLNE